MNIANHLLAPVSCASAATQGRTTPDRRDLRGHAAVDQDLSQFAGLQGNLGLLAGRLLVTWTLVAFGEELAYRGFILTRITDVTGPNLVGVAVAVGVSSVLFGLAHTEHGTVGVVVTFLDALFFNHILADTCSQYGANCRWDGGATYNYKFSASQVSVLDFFHPDLDGQPALARVSWAASWWPTT